MRYTNLLNQKDLLFLTDYNNYTQSTLKMKRIKGDVEIIGLLFFEAEIDNYEVINDKFNIRIFMPHGYPSNLPRVYSDNIKREFDHFLKDGSLCLATPADLLMRLIENSSLETLIKEIIIPYLASYSFWLKNGIAILDERDHFTGIIDFYKEFFNINDLGSIELFLKDKFKYHHIDINSKCLCGSGKNYFDCHYKKVRQLPNSDYIESDLQRIMIHNIERQKKLQLILNNVIRNAPMNRYS